MGDSGTSGSTDIDGFITRWADSGAAERANYQLFLTELCDFLGVDRPEPTTDDDARNTYVFEKPVTFPNPDGSSSTGRIDLYRRGHFVCETKQGSERKKEQSDPAAPKIRTRTGHGIRGTQAWDAAMVAARGQAERYVRAIPDDNPPFVLVIDVGYSIEVYSDFSRLGKIYTPFPDARSHRIYLKDLASDDLRQRLKLIWTDPLALDPARHSAKVTRDIADSLARLARSLEGEGHDPEHVAAFLMRCLFTLFAEDVELIKDHAFTKLLEEIKTTPEQFVPMVRDVWRAMDAGDFSPALRKKLMKFNGGLFAEQTVLKLNTHQLEILHEAARCDWRHVEPAIFGTLLERALDPTERHKLGAHYTPRAYVERLVLPTIIEPLREEWDAAKAAAITLRQQGDHLLAEAQEHPAQTPKDREQAEKLLRQARARRREATAALTDYLKRLCDTIVLDPACGSGNFLYVTLEHMKRLEGEVRDQLQQFGETQADFESMGLTVDPHQFKGIEINPRAAHIADLVLWIGYLQWHFRVYGNTPPREPVLRAFHNIENRDAVLAYDKKELVRDETGKPLSRWDGRTMKKHPVTGEDVPDESAQVPVYRYVNPLATDWRDDKGRFPDFIVGNPPYLGARRIRAALGDGYLAELRRIYGNVPEHADYVMYWWHKAAGLVRRGHVRRFGLITTNSISQAFSRKLLEMHLNETPKLTLRFVIPDHPWVDTADGAAVRVALSVGTKEAGDGSLVTVGTEVGSSEEPGTYDLSLTEVRGDINPDLTIGTTVVGTAALKSNDGLGCVGFQLTGQGFVLGREEDKAIRSTETEPVLHPFLTARDLAQQRRSLTVIDVSELTVDELRQHFVSIYQWLIDRVKPERDQNNRPSVRDRWWVYGEARRTFRPALKDLSRVIVTPITSKHRFFTFEVAGTIADSTCVIFALDDAFYFGVLSSSTHRTWTSSAEGTLEDRPRYLKAECFDPFPFPDATEAQKARIRELGEQLDAHRKRQQAAHAGLTITAMYNVLEKLRAGEVLSAREKTVHEQGLVSVLKQIHDDLDAAVFDAYGWPADLSDEQILEKLVALNAERAAEEERGLIRYLRPEFQNKAGRATQGALDLPVAKVKGKKTARVARQPWPGSMAEQAKALRAVLGAGGAGTAEQIAKSFRRANRDRIAELLETLVSLGQARKVDGDRYSA